MSTICMEVMAVYLFLLFFEAVKVNWLFLGALVFGSFAFN